MPAEPPCNTGHKSQCPCWAETAGARVGSSPLECKLSLVMWKWCGCSLLSPLSPFAIKRAECSLPAAGVVELTRAVLGSSTQLPREAACPAPHPSSTDRLYPLTDFLPAASLLLSNFFGFFRKTSWSSPQLSLLNGCFSTW